MDTNANVRRKATPPVGASQTRHITLRLCVFNAILSDDEASRATSVVKALRTHGFRGALTGGVAIEAQLRARGRRSGRRLLNDLDFVVESFASIPESIADRFLALHPELIVQEKYSVVVAVRSMQGQRPVPLRVTRASR